MSICANALKTAGVTACRKCDRDQTSRVNSGGIVNWVISSVFFHELPIVNMNCLWPLPMLTVALETFQDWWCKLKIQLSIELFLFIRSSIQTTHAALNGF